MAIPLDEDFGLTASTVVCGDGRNNYFFETVPTIPVPEI
jgi:hypothetical protein